MISRRYRVLLGATLTATALCLAAAVHGQPGNPIWDSSQLPETRGTVKQYTLTPRGDVDGLILTDGTEIKLPPHLTAQVVFAVRPGDAVSVRGLKARVLPLVDAASVTNTASGVTISDSRPPDGRGRMVAETTLSGTIAAVLHGKRGEVNGAVLSDGTILRLPPPEAERMQALLQPDRTVAARGVKLATPLGSVVDVRALGSSTEQLTELNVPPRGPKGGPKGPKGKKGRDEFAPPPRG